MDASQIVSNIEKHVCLSEEERAYWKSFLVFKFVQKNEHILTEGEFCQQLHFVNSGTLRAYFLNHEGKETTVMFAIKDWWITDMFSFAKEKPAMLNIEATEPAHICSIAKADMDQVLSVFPKFERFFRIIFQNAYIREQVRVIQNLSLTAEERYLSLISQYPYLEQTVTQKQIASYLGITPEFLSKMKKRLREHKLLI